MEQIKVGQHIRDQITCSIVGRLFRRQNTIHKRPFGPEIILQSNHYVRNMTEGGPFTDMGLKDAELIGTALLKEKVQLSYE